MNHPRVPSSVVVALPARTAPDPRPSLAQRLWSAFTAMVEEKLDALTENWETPFLYDGLDDED